MKTKIRAFVMAVIMMLCMTVTVLATEPTDYIDCSAQIDSCLFRQQVAHLTAEHLRSIGSGMDFAITVLQSEWADVQRELDGWRKLSQYTYEELDYATMLAYNEAKYCGDDHQQYVVAVLVNRLHDSRFKDTVKACIESPGQYSLDYTNKSLIAQYAESDPDEWLRCRSNAIVALREMTDMPTNVVFQSEFPKLGTGTWKVCHTDTGYYTSDTYFNYG